MERQVRYCTTEDGVRIAYCVEGEGPPLMVCDQMMSFSQHYLAPEVEDFYHQIGDGRTLIYYDVRGTGLSERQVEDLSLEATLGDMQAVADAASLDRFAIWAPGPSGVRAIKFTAQYPDRVSALILYSAFARAEDASTPEAYQMFEALAQTNWGLFCQTFVDMGAARAEAGDRPLRMAQVIMRSADGPTTARFIRQNKTADVTPFLGKISARTLVIHRIADSVRPIALSQALAASIPGARLVTPPGAVLGWMWGDVKAITDPINAFLDEDPATRAIPIAKPALVSESAFRTVLFTDLVGHTEMMQRLGDERGRDVLREHERITREVLKAHGGTEVKTMGDGFMASFGSVTKAVECAVALQRAFNTRNTPVGAPLGADDAAGRGAAPGGAAAGHPVPEPLNIRVGLNAGEPIEEDGDLFGATIILASRIAAKAEGGEILVADTVRGLCSGKGFLFADRGEFVAKGIEEPVRVYEVRWRE